jgi:glutamate dehydrogenase/leucine dehydrogenase
MGLAPEKARVAVQGFGNVGSTTALALVKAGLRVVAVADSRGTVHRPEGLAPAHLIDHKRRTGAVVGFPGAIDLPSAAVLAVDCDVLVPAALENAITLESAGPVRARLVVEGANGPTTPAADDLLAKSGVTVIPDILANAGGVTVSYFEWCQARQGSRWDVGTVTSRLESVMRTAYRSVVERARARGVDLRAAAYELAVGRVVEAMRLRGWV